MRGIHDAVAGWLALTPRLSSRVVEVMRAPRARLTEREHEVLRLLDTGASNRKIAKTLFVSEATVKTHPVHLRQAGRRQPVAGCRGGRETGLL